MELRQYGLANVVSLFGGKAAPGYPAIAQVDAYWEGLRRGRPMPDRAEIDPRGIEGALEFAFVLERVAPGVARVRIAGAHLADLLGMDVRGMPLTAFFVPDARARIERAVEAVLGDAQVADVTLTGERGIGRPALPARLLLAPLANAGGRGMPRLLACLESHGTIGRAPRRFAVEQMQMRRIVASADAAPAPAEPAAPVSVAPARASGRAPHLRLVAAET